MNPVDIPYQYICIEGNIGSGKTSLTELLQKEFECQVILEEFNDNPFLPLFYQDKDRYAFSVELFFLTERYKQMQRILLHQDLFRQFTVADYSFVKSLLFAKMNLPDDEFRLFQKMWEVLRKSFPQPDLLVFLHRNVETLQNFIIKRGREYESLIAAEYLHQIQDTYFEYFRNILSYPILIIDVNQLDFVAHDAHYQSVKEIITRDYLPGVHRVSLLV